MTVTIADIVVIVGFLLMVAIHRALREEGAYLIYMPWLWLVGLLSLGVIYVILS